MIFQQWREILEGRKTQTRRIVRPGDYDVAHHSSTDIFYVAVYKNGGYGFTRWQVGKTYAVVPKRGQRAIWWTVNSFGKPSIYPDPIKTKANEQYARDKGFQQARIRITTIRREPLQSISYEDARAEGAPPDHECDCYSPVLWYASLWNRINNRKGIRWEDDPDVWVLEFRLVKNKLENRPPCEAG